jgi:hypothetical protein
MWLLAALCVLLPTPPTASLDQDVTAGVTPQPTPTNVPH